MITDGAPTDEKIDAVIASMKKSGYELIPGERENLFETLAQGEYRHVALKFNKNGDGLYRELLLIQPNMFDAKMNKGGMSIMRFRAGSR